MLSERAGRGEGNSAAIGVPEGKFFRMQQQAVCGSKRFAFGVKLVAEDHMANRFHMHAQLVRAARQGKSRSRVVRSLRSSTCQRVCAGLPCS